MLKQRLLRLTMATAVVFAVVNDADARQWYNLNVIVYNTSNNAGIPGALVTIDQDFGNGTQRNADGGGFTNFGVTEAAIGYTASAAGFLSGSGSTYVVNHTTVYIGLAPASGGGRYQLNGSGASLECIWVSGASGPDQCDPNVAPTTPPALAEPSYTTYDDTGNSLASSDYSYQGGLNATAAGFIPSCRAYTKNGSHGYVSVQTDPWSGTVALGAYMYNGFHNYGPWLMYIWVNGVHVPSGPKFQLYPIHTSIPPAQAPAGSIVHVQVYHQFLYWKVGIVFTPEGARLRGGWHIALSSGNLTCMVPFPGL